MNAVTAAGGLEVTRVLVCDDSDMARTMLERLMAGDACLRVVGHAVHGLEAVRAVQAGGIDVVVLDVEMPVMDGLTALPRLLEADRAVRVLMASSLTTAGAGIALEALRLGAADFIAKPSAIRSAGAQDSFRAELLAKVRGLGRQCRAHRARLDGSLRHTQAAIPATGALQLRAASRLAPAVLAIGSSTGGPAALLSLFQALGTRVAVPMVLTQHMPASFTAQLASHIQRLGGATCAEAVHGEALRPGHVHLAPGNRHLTVVAGPAGAEIALTDDAPENFCRPAVDPMLRSLSAAFPGRVLALMLTGMGHDGLAGARQVVADGGFVIAQDEESSVVWGMPGAVARAGLCHAVLPLAELAPRLLQHVARPGPATGA